MNDARILEACGIVGTDVLHCGGFRVVAVYDAMKDMRSVSQGELHELREACIDLIGKVKANEEVEPDYVIAACIDLRMKYGEGWPVSAIAQYNWEKLGHFDMYRAGGVWRSAAAIYDAYVEERNAWKEHHAKAQRIAAYRPWLARVEVVRGLQAA